MEKAGFIATAVDNIYNNEKWISHPRCCIQRVALHGMDLIPFFAWHNGVLIADWLFKYYDDTKDEVVWEARIFHTLI